jgi:hypothetical protein
VRRVDDGGRRVAGREEERLAVPQVRLAVDGAQPARVDERRAVVQRVSGVLGEAADDDQAARGGALGPAAHGRAARRLGQRERLGRVAEHVARGGELGQHDDLRARVGGGVDRGERPGAVAVEVADDRRQLVDGDAHGAHARHSSVAECACARIGVGAGGDA